MKHIQQSWLMQGNSAGVTKTKQRFLTLKHSTKKLRFLAVLMSLFGICTAQTSLTTAVDFTVTDTQGNSHTLFNYLNSGKYVCIDFFFTTCGPCQATSPYFKQTYTNFGCNTQDIFFMAIDNNDNNAQVMQYEQTYLGGNAGYPEISGIEGGGNAVVSTYSIGAFPTYILIAPNHQIIETDMWPISSAADFTTYFNNHSLTPKPCLVTGISTNQPSFEFACYPNPANEIITVEGPILNGDDLNIKIFNNLGQLTHEEELVFTNGKSSLTVKGLPNGVYTFSATGKENFTVNKKIVISR